MVLRCVVTALLILGVSCRDDPAPKSRSKPKPPAPALCPLTGEKAPPGTPPDRPVLAIKIDNAARARPQSGLESADIVYEELAEGGITRFLALFQCNEESSIGPIRSARLVDSDILVEYKPVLLGYSGANKEVLKKIRSTQGVIDLQYATHGSSYQKAAGRPAPHNIFTSTEKLRALSDSTGAPRIGFIFQKAGQPEAKKTGSLSPSPSGTPSEPPGKAISLSFAGATPTRYVYDAASGKYSRFLGDHPFVLEGEGQLRVTNVLVLRVKVSQSQTRDAAGNFSPEISVIGRGEVIVLFGGISHKAEWTRESLAAHTRLIDAAGKDLSLLPGNTWIHLLPTERPVTIE